MLLLLLQGCALAVGWGEGHLPAKESWKTRKGQARPLKEGRGPEDVASDFCPWGSAKACALARMGRGILPTSLEEEDTHVRSFIPFCELHWTREELEEG